jgi:hypothetical protein
VLRILDVLILGLVVGCSSLIQPPEIRAEFESRGTYQHHEEHASLRSQSSAPREFQHLASRRSIPCREGTWFGAIYRLRLVGGTQVPLVAARATDDGSGRVALGSSGQQPERVKLVVRWKHPLFVGAGGRSFSESEQYHTLSHRAAHPRYFGWRLTRDELQNGTWELEVSYRDETIIHEVFTLDDCPGV